MVLSCQFDPTKLKRKAWGPIEAKSYRPTPKLTSATKIGRVHLGQKLREKRVSHLKYETLDSETGSRAVNLSYLDWIRGPWDPMTTMSHRSLPGPSNTKSGSPSNDQTNIKLQNSGKGGRALGLLSLSVAGHYLTRSI